MCLYFASYFCLPLFDRLLMLLTNIFINFKRFSQLLRCFPKIIFCKFAQICSLSHKILMIINTIHDYVKKSNSPTCIFSILLHKKDVFGHLVVFKGKCLLLLVLSLELVNLVKKHQA